MRGNGYLTSDTAFHAICEAVQLISRSLKLLYTGAVSVVLRRTLGNCCSVSGSTNKTLLSTRPNCLYSSAGMAAPLQGYEDRHFHNTSNLRKSGVLPPLPRIHYGFTACRGTNLCGLTFKLFNIGTFWDIAHAGLRTVHSAHRRTAYVDIETGLKGIR